MRAQEATPAYLDQDHHHHVDAQRGVVKLAAAYAQLVVRVGYRVCTRIGLPVSSHRERQVEIVELTDCRAHGALG